MGQGKDYGREGNRSKCLGKVYQEDPDHTRFFVKKFEDFVLKEVIEPKYSPCLVPE